MEVWDLYNVNREVIGSHVRGMELPENGYHLVVHVWIRNSEGKYLMAQRSPKKKTYPLKWECVGGSALQGESSIFAAIREVYEEVGIQFRGQDGILLFTKIRGTESGRRYNDIVDVWLFEFDGEIDLRKAITDEVVDAAWMPRAQIEMLRANCDLVTSIKDLEYFFDEMTE